MDEFRASSERGEAKVRGWGDYAEWVALGAVIAGSVGAIVGASRCAPRPRTMRHADLGGPATLTPPHGDKLHA